MLVLSGLILWGCTGPQMRSIEFSNICNSFVILNAGGFEGVGPFGERSQYEIATRSPRWGSASRSCDRLKSFSFPQRHRFIRSMGMAGQSIPQFPPPLMKPVLLLKRSALKPVQEICFGDDYLAKDNGTMSKVMSD